MKIQIIPCRWTEWCKDRQVDRHDIGNSHFAQYCQQALKNKVTWPATNFPNWCFRDFSSANLTWQLVTQAHWQTICKEIKINTVHKSYELTTFKIQTCPLLHAW